MMRVPCCSLAITAALLFATITQADERPSGFVDAATTVPGLIVEMRYAASRNFVGEPIAGYERSVCLLTWRAAQALALVQSDLAVRGLELKVFDCYRPQRAVEHFVRWARDPADIRGKAEYYPEINKRDLFALGYVARRSGHSRGSTVDLTLVRRADGAEVDMGTGFDLFSRKSSPADRSVGQDAQGNRATLAAFMQRRGFKPYNKEWWHFTLRDEPFRDRYFDFPVR